MAIAEPLTPEYLSWTIGAAPGDTDPAMVLVEMLRRPPWQDEAACRGEPVETFFPERGSDGRPARAICTRCPVRAPCLEYALDHSAKFGVWGGTSERQRRSLRRKTLPERPETDAPDRRAILALLDRGLRSRRAS